MSSLIFIKRPHIFSLVRGVLKVLVMSKILSRDRKSDYYEIWDVAVIWLFAVR